MNKKQLWEAVTVLARQGIKAAFNNIPAPDQGTAREDWVVQFTIEHVENVDQTLPVIGRYLDLPIADLVEGQIVRSVVHEVFRALVRQQYAALKIESALNGHEVTA